MEMLTMLIIIGLITAVGIALLSFGILNLIKNKGEKGEMTKNGLPITLIVIGGIFILPVVTVIIITTLGIFGYIIYGI